MNQEDYIVRAMGADRQLRLFAVTSRNLVERAREIHNTSPVATAALGRLLTAGSMMGSMMKGDKDVLTLQIQCGGPIGGLTVTADAQANVKGYVKEPNVILPPNAKGKLDVAGAVGPGFLNVIRDIGMKEPYNGQTHLVSGEIAEDLTYYYATSESVTIVENNSFIPEPEVDSEVIKLKIRKEYPVKLLDEQHFFKVIKASFTQRRKTLINALVNTGMLKNKEQAKELFDNLKMDYNTRGETLSIEQFAEISNYIVKNKI